MRAMEKISIIIPTFNRPRELTNCIISVLEQTVRSYELIVVDDGNLREQPLREECQAAGIRYIYYKKDRPGMAASRNVGIGLATGDVVFFLDDDVVLFPDYLEEILNTYHAYRNQYIAGVGGIIANMKPLTLGKRLWRICDLLFLNAGIEEGKALKSGFITNFGETEIPLRRVTSVDFLMGGVCSFRREIFKEFLFLERYRRHGHGKADDKEFSYRVSKKYKLLVNPKAKLFHYKSPKMRYGKRKFGQEFVFGRYRFFKDLIHKNDWDWIFFFYAIIGYLLKRVIVLFISFDISEVDHVRGAITGFMDILRRREL